MAGVTATTFSRTEGAAWRQDLLPGGALDWRQVVFGPHRFHSRVGVYGALGTACLVVALALGRPELAIVAAPLLVLVIAGVMRLGPPELEVALSAAATTVLEEDEIELRVNLRGPRRVANLDLLLALPPGLIPVDPARPAARSLSFRGEEEQVVVFRLRPARWGIYRVGPLSIQTWERLHTSSVETTIDASVTIRVLPHLGALRSLVTPADTRVTTGNQVSRRAGDGMEFADIRPYQPGDRARSINWRISARHDQLWVNDHHPEQSTDVLLFLDIFELAADFKGENTLDRSVRAAARLASAYLARKDRVGLVALGGYLSWVPPGTGTATLYRILDVLLQATVVSTTAYKDIESLPIRGLPSRALVLAISPLLDERAVQVLFGLRRHGWDVAIVDVSPLQYGAPGSGGRIAASLTKGTMLDRVRRPLAHDELDHAKVGRLAHRLWTLQRQRLHEDYRSSGISVVEWDRVTDVDTAIMELEMTRRSSRRGL
ncbi:MAG: DUF58 domain-containing protein [Acidimicrobiales bacterium]